MCKDCGCQNECECGCCCEGHGLAFEGGFQAKAQQIAELEAYLSQLKLEVQAVEEHLADLRK